MENDQKQPTIYENKTNPISIAKGTYLYSYPHFHRHLELIYLEKGHVRAFCGKNSEEMFTGDLFLAFPDQIHFYNNLETENESQIHYLFIFNPSLCTDLQRIFSTKIPQKNVLHAGELKFDAKTLVRELYNTSNDTSDCSLTIQRGYINLLAGNIVRQIGEMNDSSTNGNLLVEIIKYCNEHFLQDITLNQIAHAVGVEKTYLSKIINSKLNTSFTDLINQLRIDEAKRRLKENSDESITEIAYECGFSCMRTFNRNFTKIVGLTPSTYRKIKN